MVKGGREQAYTVLELARSRVSLGEEPSNGQMALCYTLRNTVRAPNPQIC